MALGRDPELLLDIKCIVDSFNARSMFFCEYERKCGYHIVKAWLKPLPLVVNPSIRQKGKRQLEEALQVIVDLFKNDYKFACTYKYKSGLHTIEARSFDHPHLSRPAYIHYYIDTKEKILAKNPGMGLLAVASICRSKWLALNDEERIPYRKKAYDDQIRYQLELALYKSHIRRAGY